MPISSNYKFSYNSQKELQGVNQKLVQVAERAIELTTVDFGISQGLRTVEEQIALVQSGASQTMNSKHLDGKAVDVFAYFKGRARWEASFYYEICKAFKQAGAELNVPIRWGGAWHINDISKTKVTPREASEAYISLRTIQGRTPFLDYVHFELGKNSS